MASHGSLEAQNELASHLTTLERQITWPESKRGIGYLSSSFRHNIEMERLWTAVVANLFLEAGYHPLIVPIDAFYGFYPEGTLSLVQKTTLLSSVLPHDVEGRMHAIILTGISESGIFTEQTLDDIPSQDALWKSKTIAKIVSDFTVPLVQLFGKAPSARTMPEHILETLKSGLGDKSGVPSLNQIRLLLGMTLLLQDRNSWQNLWYERKDGGVPLYIVAPQSFHYAIDRLNTWWGHGRFDYTYRASNSLGAHRAPVFDRLKGQLLSSKEIQERIPLEEDFLDWGLTSERLENYLSSFSLTSH